MKLCVLCGAAPNTNDPVGDFAWLLANELASEGEVLFIAPENGNAIDSEVIPIHRVIRGWGFKAAKQVLRLIEKIKPQVILVHFVPQLYGWHGAKPVFAMMLLALRRRGCRIVTIAHEFSSPFGPSLKLMLWASAHQVLLRLIIKASRSIVLTNKLYREILSRRFPDRRCDIHWIPIGCALPVISLGETDRQQLRKHLAIGDRELIVSTFGTAVESVASALEPVFDWIISEGWPARFLIIGKSSESLGRHLARNPAIRERVIVTGPVSNEAVSGYLSISDLYVVFYADGASTRRSSLVVGLAHGAPTISNSGILTDSLLSSSGAFYMMTGAMKDGDTERLRQLCASSEERKRLGDKGRAFFEENFSWAKIGNQYRRVIEESREK